MFIEKRALKRLSTSLSSSQEKYGAKDAKIFGLSSSLLFDCVVKFFLSATAEKKNVPPSPKSNLGDTVKFYSAASPEVKPPLWRGKQKQKLVPFPPIHRSQTKTKVNRNGLFQNNPLGSRENCVGASIPPLVAIQFTWITM